MKVLDIGTKWSWVVSFMPWPFYSRQGTPSGVHWMGRLLDPRDSLYPRVVQKYLLLTYLLTYLHTNILTYIQTYLLTPWSKVLLEKLIGFKPVKKFPTFYGTRRFITAFTSASHLSLSWASSIQSIPPHPTSWRSILILSSHLRQVLPSGTFPSGFPTKTLYTSLLSPIRSTCPAHPILLDVITWRMSCEEYTQEDLWPSEIKPIFLGRIQALSWSLHQLSYPHCLTITLLHILLWRICRSYIRPKVVSARDFERHT